MEDDSESPAKLPTDPHESEEEKGWILYIGAICNRRTVNDMLIDMWRCGENEWVTNVGGIVQRTAEAVKVVEYWYVETVYPVPQGYYHLRCSPVQTPLGTLTYDAFTSFRHEMSQEQLALAEAQANVPVNENLHFYLWSRRVLCFEKIYRPILYLAVHYHSLPAYLQSNTQLFREVFSQAQKGIDNCAALIPHWWYHHRHEWIWNIMRSTFGAAVQILAAVLSSLHARQYGAWMLTPPHDWAALVRISIKTLRYWGGESIDVEIMRTTLERMYQGTCRLAGEPANLFSA